MPCKVKTKAYVREGMKVQPDTDTLLRKLENRIVILESTVERLRTAVFNDTAPTPTVEDLEGYTKADLKKLADHLKVAVNSRMTKAEIVECLYNHLN